MDLVLRFPNRGLADALGETTKGEERMLVLTGNFFRHDPSLPPGPIVGNACVIIRGVRVPPEVLNLMGPAFQGPGQ